MYVYVCYVGTYEGEKIILCCEKTLKEINKLLHCKILRISCSYSCNDLHIW